MRIDLPEGYVDFGREGKNEVDVVSTSEDPPKLRLGATLGGGLGAISFNRVRADGRHEEVGYILGKIDERWPNELAGELTIHLRKRNGTMAHVATLRHDGIAFHVPVGQSGVDDAFAQQVTAWYRELLHRTPSPAEVDSHRGNPGGLAAVHALILAAAP